MGINVALDGPSGAGKSTIAKRIATELKYVYVDTGALYRSIAYYVISKGAKPDDKAGVIPLLPEISVKLEYRGGAQHVILNDEDVSDKIRTPEISMGASAVSAIPEVRDFLFDLQRDIAANNDIIMDGRDIGTVVLPDAQVKIFLTASAEERANRRFKELQEKGDPSTYDEVLKDIIQRDYNDTHREIAPLKKAEDAIEVDSTSMSLDEVVEHIKGIITEKAGAKKKRVKPEGEKKERKPLLDFSDIPPVKRGKKLNPIKLFFYNMLRYIVIFLLKCWFNLKFEGKENVPKDGSNIFASNHRSMLDPVLVELQCRVPNSFMAKEELFEKNKAFVGLIKFWGAFPIARGKGDTDAIKLSFEKLESGRNLLIFPEGTRSLDGKVGRGKTGVALIAAVAQCPVVPVGINFEGKLKFRRKIVVRFGKPISPEQLKVTTPGPKELKLLRTTIMDAITELVH
ncbi:MAG: (d)CMP kinase [Ruminococcus sp.]|nr:(d)CMP kinase [Ruminococcus sp.]